MNHTPRPSGRYRHGEIHAIVRCKFLLVRIDHTGLPQSELFSRLCRLRSAAAPPFLPLVSFLWVRCIPATVRISRSAMSPRIAANIDHSENNSSSSSHIQPSDNTTHNSRTAALRDYSHISVVMTRKQVRQVRDGGATTTTTASPAPRLAPSTSKSTSKSTPTSSTSTFIQMTTLLRTTALALATALLFSTTGVTTITYAIRNLYRDLYLPLMDRATRTDRDLDREFTYYHRYCTEADLTTRDLSDLVADAQAPASHAVEQMMQHGGIVIRDLLKPETVRQLREYAVYRNHHIPDEEVYPVSQGHNRMSFGYDATEHPAVVQALQELSHNALLKQVLSTILGDEDPASSEITTITAYYGAPPQAWHSDTKEDGNALKFARTYSHSYSLFLPLQNTTAAMGMSDICPGTHYCANDLSEMCEATKMSLGAAAGSHFRAGDGALLNQIVWHRGAEHRDPHALERIVMIVSFLARPNMQEDPRQLSRGTYFHQKWNMWGHTWKDLMDPMLSMQKPFSYLRALSLWKPPTHSWGYDLITSGFMRFSNEQLDDEAIRARLWPRLDQIHFPSWLRADLPDEYELGQKQSWKLVLEGTIDRTLVFLRQVVWKAHVVYLLVGAVVATTRGRRPASRWRAMVHLLLGLVACHAVVVLLVGGIWYRIRSSPWGVAVRQGRALLRPFPEIPILTSEELAFAPRGPTTFPDNNDVLFGTRYDAKFLGEYEHYLDWHKGNKPYLRAIRGYAPLYQSYQRLPVDLARRLVEGVRDAVAQTHGRFLEQDYRTGAWRILAPHDVTARIHTDLTYSSSAAKSALRPVLRRLIARGRYGFGRETALARKGVVALLRFEQALLGPLGGSSDGGDGGGCMPSSHPDNDGDDDDNKPSAVPWSGGTPRFRATLGQVSIPKQSKLTTTIPAHCRGPGHAHDAQPPFPVGTTVYVEERVPDDEVAWDRGHVLEISEAGRFLTLSSEFGERRRVPVNRVHRYEPITEGDRLVACFDDEFEECFQGTAMYVAPDGSVDILFEEDGEFLRHPADMLFKPPFEYIPPPR